MGVEPRVGASVKAGSPVNCRAASGPKPAGRAGEEEARRRTAVRAVAPTISTKVANLVRNDWSSLRTQILQMSVFHAPDRYNIGAIFPTVCIISNTCQNHKECRCLHFVRIYFGFHAGISSITKILRRALR